MLGLPHGPRESIENKAGAIGLHPGGHDPDGKFVRDEQSLAGPGVGFSAQGGSPLAFGAQEGPGGDMGDSEGLGEALCLGSLPGGRWSEKDNPLFQRIHGDGAQRWVVR